MNPDLIWHLLTEGTALVFAGVDSAEAFETPRLLPRRAARPGRNFSVTGQQAALVVPVAIAPALRGAFMRAGQLLLGPVPLRGAP